MNFQAHESKKNTTPHWKKIENDGFDWPWIDIKCINIKQEKCCSEISKVQRRDIKWTIFNVKEIRSKLGSHTRQQKMQVVESVIKIK